MKSLKIILNIYQNPNNILRYIIENNKQLYIPMSAGSKLKNVDIWCNNNLIFDDDFQTNISNLNNRFNEMTSIYACWKNYEKIANSDYIGFNHYRRFFNPIDFLDFEKYDIIVAKRYRLYSSLLHHYERAHKSVDIYNMINILSNEFSQQKLNNFMYKNELYAPCNMFIMKKSIFFKYCEFIFNKLFKLNNIITVDSNNEYQARALAFISERLTSFWMTLQKENNLAIKEIPIVFFKDWSK